MSSVLNFDASQVAPDSGSQDALPAGWYDVMMVESVMKPTKGGDGAYLECKFNVIAPAQHQNKKVYTRLNLRNANATAQEIGYKQLSAICHAVGVLQVADSAQLHNLPLKVKLKLRKADGEYDASNEITSFKNINEQVALAGVAAGASPFAAPAAPGFGMPPAPPAPAPFAPPAAPVAPAFGAAPQPWGQPPAAPVAPAVAPIAPQPYAPAPAAAPMPAQPPAWGGAPAPAPVAQPAAQPAPVAAPAQAVQQAATATPPWMAQPQQ